MYNIVFSLIVTCAFLALLITSSIKWGAGSYEKCGLVFYGHIKKINTAYLTENKTTAIVVAVVDVYKIRDSMPKFVETYTIITDLKEAMKYNLQGSYENSTLVKLYKNCEYKGFEAKKTYYFEDITYLQGTIWQSILAYTVMAFIISAIISGFCISEHFRKPTVIRYTSSDFPRSVYSDPLTASQTPDIRIFESTLDV